MPQIDFAPENKISKSVEFDRLKLKKDEKARILILEKPTDAWVHTLRAPKIVDGQAAQLWQHGRRGDKYLDYDMDFIGRPLCTGDYGILADKGVDGKNCPACKVSMESKQVPPPERRFAMNIIRYATNRDGKLLKPFQASCVVWTYTENIYNKLVDIASETGGLIGNDLVIGPCVSESFQNYENYLPSRENAWKADARTEELVKEVFDLNRIADLDVACGRRVDRKWIEADIKQIADRWAVAEGTARTPDAGEKATLDDELSKMIHDDPWAEPTPSAAPALDAVVDTPTPSNGPAMDFQDLLNQIDNRSS